jgi:phosphoenolpyruvate carboxylase
MLASQLRETLSHYFGEQTLAFHSLNNYFLATLRATVDLAAAPLPQWRTLMDTMATASLHAYRSVVQQNPDFVPYFRSLTPEQELKKLALGSRPPRRNTGGGIASLRAILWIFAWSQARFNLPAWLGIRQALETGLGTAPETLQDMLQRWPYFASFLDLIEMVLGKTDSAICAHYEDQLVEPRLKIPGASLRADLEVLTNLLNHLKKQTHLLASAQMLQKSIEVRKSYMDPLNYLQAELLKRERKVGAMAPELEQALKVTMSGIAAGMRNTG